MNELEILKEARELISDKNRWCPGSLASDSAFSTVAPNDESATRWCAIGSIRKIMNSANQDYTNDPVEAKIRSLLNKVGEEVTSDMYNSCITISLINDFQGHSAVLKCFDLAIAKLEFEEEIDNLLKSEEQPLALV